MKTFLCLYFEHNQFSEGRCDHFNLMEKLFFLCPFFVRYLHISLRDQLGLFCNCSHRHWSLCLKMNPKGLIYSFVARGTVVLAEHTPYSGNFSTIAVQCLQKLPSNSSKYTYSCDGHTFNFLIDSGFGIYSSYNIWCCI